MLSEGQNTTFGREDMRSLLRLRNAPRTIAPEGAHALAPLFGLRGESGQTALGATSRRGNGAPRLRDTPFPVVTLSNVPVRVTRPLLSQASLPRTFGATACASRGAIVSGAFRRRRAKRMPARPQSPDLAAAFSSRTAWAAANRANGTRYGLQLT
jgi:hypothetical protein